MAITDDAIPEPPLIERPASISIVDGEVVISGGTQVLVMSREAALDLAWRISEVVGTVLGGHDTEQNS